MISPFCILSNDGLGVQCSRCGSWLRGNDAPDCPPYVTRSEPDYARLPHLAVDGANQRAHRDFMENWHSRNETENGGVTL